MQKDGKNSPSQTNSFPRTCRLQGRKAILDVIRRGTKLCGTKLSLSYVKATPTRFGISIPKGYDKAVRRNRKKRAIREFLRQHKSLWPKDRWIMIRLPDKSKGNRSLEEEKQITEELHQLLGQIR